MFEGWTFLTGSCLKRSQKIRIFNTLSGYQDIRNILMPLLKIAPGGKQEALSIPFQQTALYVQKYGNELSQEEYEIINAVLPADEIAELYVADRAGVLGIFNTYTGYLCVAGLCVYYGEERGVIIVRLLENLSPK